MTDLTSIDLDQTVTVNRSHVEQALLTYLHETVHGAGFDRAEHTAVLMAGDVLKAQPHAQELRLDAGIVWTLGYYSNALDGQDECAAETYERPDVWASITLSAVVDEQAPEVADVLLARQSARVDALVSEHHGCSADSIVDHA